MFETQIMTWQQAVQAALENLWMNVASKVPNILAAIIILFLGLILATLLGRLVHRMVDYTKFDVFLHKTVGLSKLKERGMDINAAGLLGWVVKWFFIVVTFIAVADILNWDQLTSFFGMVASYIPNVLITVLILLTGFILGGGLKDIVIKGVKAADFTDASAGMVGTVARWAVIVFAFMAGLTQLGIAADLVKILFTAFVGMLALAGGLAFGLGGQEKASQWLDRIHKEIKK
ncbi:MAG: hypothetical protein Q7T11_09230 [Deltaproteobacteria bacterium]|nr:hypothetical protein [Deltaproteobacteria bacterium]